MGKQALQQRPESDWPRRVNSFQLPLGSEPVQVCERLWGQEVDSLRETEKHWGAVQSWLSSMMSWANLNDITNEETLVFPGMEELFNLMQIKQHALSGAYDVIIVDCAPTGQTLRLLSYPNLLRWWMEKIFPHERRLIKLVRPIAKVVTGGLELPNEHVLDSIESFVRELEDLQTMIADHSVTTVRMVINPEKMVISEARRAFTYLNLFGFNTDAIVVNRLLPAEAGIGYWSTWREIHAKYEEEINTCFNPLPILKVPQLELEVLGVSMLERIGEEAFAHCDASAILYQGRIQEIRKAGDDYFLDLALPFVQKEELQLSEKGDELTVQAGPYKHKVLLPRSLQGRSIAGARLTGQKLSIRFGKRVTNLSAD